MEARAEVLPLLLLFVARLCDCQVLVPDSRVVIEPTSEVPPTFTTLICVVTPDSVNIAIRWILPNGTNITQGTTDRFFVDQGTGGGHGRLNVILLIDQLSYRDAGLYICEVMDLIIPNATWISAIVQLQLNVNLQNEADTMTTDSDATLRCEMAGFIRPDEDLQWFRGGQQITNGSRHTVTYEDGRPTAAQNGSSFRVPARVSVLTISDPVIADSGVYTCRIQGTTESTNIQLIGFAGSSTPIWIVAPIIVGVLLLFPMGILVGICIYKQKRIHSPSDSSHNSPRDIDLEDNIAYGQASPQQPAAIYEEASAQVDHQRIEMSGNVAYGQISQ